jgi:hypothetical protein
MKDRQKALAEARGDIRHFWGQLSQPTTPARRAMQEHRIAQAEANASLIRRICGPVPSFIPAAKG